MISFGNGRFDESQALKSARRSFLVERSIIEKIIEEIKKNRANRLSFPLFFPIIYS